MDWKLFLRKLGSRKLWAAIGSVMLSLMTAFGVDNLTQERVNVVYGAIVSLIVYIITEGRIDAARERSNNDSK